MKVIDTNIEGVHFIFCPACKCAHWFSTSGKTPSHPNEVRNNLKWTWNGDREKPTIRASLLVKSSQVPICHSFITDGNIHYLDDCTHDLKGKTVPLEDMED